MSVNYPATNLCNSASKDALKDKLYEALNNVNRKWNLCTLTDNNGCVGLQVNVKCENEEEDETELVRSIRATSPSALRVQIEIPVKRNPVNEPGSIIRLSPADVIQNEVINGTTFNFEKVLPNGHPDLSSFQLVEEFSCQPGQVPIGDSCVPCAPGQFHSSVTNQCELCAEGDYQPLTGRTECFKCPTGQITPGKGAIYEQECKPNCPPGHQLNAATSTCVPCGFGFYQPSGGSFTCIACGVGKTTLTDKATSEQECRDECPDGEQLSHAGICQACPVGSYRTRGEHKQCIECPIGTTTEGKSSTRREQCNTPRCNPGQFLVRETKHCQFCPRGAYQDEPQQSTCKLCPADHTTSAPGATASSQCYSTNQCATGEYNCSWHANCIDLPDENDIPSYECVCKPFYRGNGTHCVDACNDYCLNDGICKKNPPEIIECDCNEHFNGPRCEFRIQPKSQKVTLITAAIGGVVAILVAIVIIIFMISFRFNRASDTVPEKSVGLDADIPHSNFLYTTRPSLSESLAARSRPVGYYYEDEEEYETAKRVYVSEEIPPISNASIINAVAAPTIPPPQAPSGPEFEERLRHVQQHLYMPKGQ
ncbi:hypothetical protein WR25_05809 [Diploscapter pachys]|uniref:EGF-like domain-containing protein n=1 Tax=Diploscapter pachys TaxID=2018661 RepID=A0A2A2JPA0_9BILA|nr:hypothetical protein WR25_05809 [Diploscapter pachys]